MRQKLEEYGHVCIFCFVPDFKSIKMQVHSLDGILSSTPRLSSISSTRDLEAYAAEFWFSF